jgi:hypothetical protein
MKAFDIETKSYHKVVSLDYDNNTVVMESPEYGRTRNTIDKVRLIMDGEEDLKGKEVVRPELYWAIPFIGWFVIISKLFEPGKERVIINETIKDQIIMFLAGFGPIFVLLLSIYMQS